MIVLIPGDAIECVRRMPPDSVDTIVTHPPYFMLRNQIVEALTGLSSSRSGYIDYLRCLAAELLRVVKPDGCICMAMGDSTRAKSVGLGGIWDDVADAIVAAGWPLQAIIPWTNPAEDVVLVFGRGEPRPDLPESLGHWMYIQPGYDFYIWPKEVPAALIAATCPEGGCVLDPFAGSGMTIAAAYEMGRSAVGIDIRPEYLQIAQKRIDEMLAMTSEQTEATA